MTSNIQAQQAREHHRAAAAAREKARRHQKLRNDLIRKLRQEDPAHWTYQALAKAVGCSPELVAVIVQGRV